MTMPHNVHQQRGGSRNTKQGLWIYMGPAGFQKRHSWPKMQVRRMLSVEQVGGSAGVAVCRGHRMSGGQHVTPRGEENQAVG